MNYWFRGIRNGQETCIEIEKFGCCDCFFLKWGVNREMLDSNRIKIDDVNSLEGKDIYQILEGKGILQQPTNCYSVLAKMIELTNRKGHYTDLYDKQTCKVAIENLKSMRGEVFVDDRFYEDTIKRYFVFYCPTKEEEISNIEFLEESYNQGLAYKIECNAEKQSKSLYLLGKSLIYDTQSDINFLKSVRDKIERINNCR